MGIRVITAAEFDEVQKDGGLIMVDFFADWCPPCKMLGPILDEIAAEDSNARIYKVNIEEQRELAEKYAISSLPTVILFKNGEEVDKFVGLLQKDDIKRYLKSNA